MTDKSIWIKADEGQWDDIKSRITTGLESGVDFILVDVDNIARVKELGDIKVAAFTTDEKSQADVLVIGKGSEGDGTKPLPHDFSGSLDIITATHLKNKGLKIAGYVVIHNKQYEKFAAEMASICDYVITVGTDWKVIPLENLIARLQEKDVKIISGVKTSQEAKLALQTMEHGSDGILLDTDNANEIKKTVSTGEKAGIENIKLSTAVITKAEQVGMGDRVCVDTCNLMSSGEGMLVGSQSCGLFLINSEADDSPYVASRPFRVNAGAVHAYVLVGEKTKYLCELQAGDEVTIVNADGEQRKGIVGRVKIERRPLMLIEAELNGKIVKTILQNAETIKLVGKNDKTIPVTDIKPGDEILIKFEDTGRHFGMKIEETIIEK